MSATGWPNVARLAPRLRRRALLLPGLAALMLSTLAGAATAQTEVTDAGDPYVQTQTGFAFPARIGGAARHQVIRYDADGADTGVGYRVTRNGRMIAYLSIFVYPAPFAATASGRAAACAGLFAGIERDITTHEPDARLVAETRIPAPSPCSGRAARARISQEVTRRSTGATSPSRSGPTCSATPAADG